MRGHGRRLDLGRGHALCGTRACDARHVAELHARRSGRRTRPVRVARPRRHTRAGAQPRPHASTILPGGGAYRGRHLPARQPIVAGAPYCHGMDASRRVRSVCHPQVVPPTRLACRAARRPLNPACGVRLPRGRRRLGTHGVEHAGTGGGGRHDRQRARRAVAAPSRPSDAGWEAQTPEEACGRSGSRCQASEWRGRSGRQASGWRG